jgi:MOSC domain-containing protein YiiM
MSSTARISSINVSTGGVPKRPIPEATVTVLGLEGDGHRDTEHHGGLDRALCLFSIEVIQALTAEGHTLEPGSLGENVTLEGMAWDRMLPGQRFRLGDQVVIEVTRYTSPCVNIRASFVGHEYSRVSQKRHPGWSRVYARVLATGAIRQGDPVVHLPTARDQ